jgi:ribonuclease HI/ADP-ribose pyrophosphatase YjhB (NUDIX family)
MRQKIVIRAIVSRKKRVLLLRRHGGRPSIAGLYELPGGALRDHEQPVDTLKRTLQLHSGIEPEAFKLHDVISFIDPDDADLQYLFILYFVDIADDAHVSLDMEYDRYVWREFREIEPNIMTNSTKVLLDLGGVNLVDDFSRKISSSHDNSREKSEANDDINTTVIIHSDGGSRGNPGPTAAAYIIENEFGEVLGQGGEYLGDYMTNGIAEYYGVLFGLRAAAKLGARNVNFYSDSLMVVDQLNGMFRVKELDEKVFREIKQLLFAFSRVRFRHIHREYNRSADALVNQILDENEPRLKKDLAKFAKNRHEKFREKW